MYAYKHRMLSAYRIHIRCDIYEYKCWCIHSTSLNAYFIKRKAAYIITYVFLNSISCYTIDAEKHEPHTNQPDLTCEQPNLEAAFRIIICQPKVNFLQ